MAAVNWFGCIDDADTLVDADHRSWDTMHSRCSWCKQMKEPRLPKHVTYRTRNGSLPGHKSILSNGLEILLTVTVPLHDVVHQIWLGCLGRIVGCKKLA